MGSDCISSWSLLIFLLFFIHQFLQIKQNVYILLTFDGTLVSQSFTKTRHFYTNAIILIIYFFLIRMYHFSE